MTWAWPWSAMARNLTVPEGPLAGPVLNDSCSPSPFFCSSPACRECQTLIELLSWCDRHMRVLRVALLKPL